MQETQNSCVKISMMPDDVDTQTYIEYGKTGNPLLFRRLLDKYKDPVLSTVMRVTLFPKNAAEDIVQEIFIKVIEQRERFTPTAKFSTWLYRLVVNRSYNAVRDKKHTIEFDEEAVSEDTTSALDSLVKRDRARAVRLALLELNERQRAALTLREYEEKTYAEIAQIMDTSVDAVESLIFHARTRLKTLLKGRSL